MIEILILIIVANSSPVLARNLLGSRFARPIDAGIRLIDGNPLFGQSKTWRGVIAATFGTTIVSPLLGLSLLHGALAGLSAMAGDLIASFIKRRRGIKSSGRAPLIDSIPESLFPALVLRHTLELSWLEILVVVVIFAVLVPLSSPILYRLHIRKHPW